MEGQDHLRRTKYIYIYIYKYIYIYIYTYKKYINKKDQHIVIIDEEYEVKRIILR